MYSIRDRRHASSSSLLFTPHSSSLAWQMYEEGGGGR